jgi:ABC-type Fe3+/spermidine/putrescine transport system ATPase subunit
LDLQENDVLILKGRSGSGKTTLLKCIAQLNVYDKGKVLLNGK